MQKHIELFSQNSAPPPPPNPLFLPKQHSKATPTQNLPDSFNAPQSPLPSHQHPKQHQKGTQLLQYSQKSSQNSKPDESQPALLSHTYSGPIDSTDRSEPGLPASSSFSRPVNSRAAGRDSNSNINPSSNPSSQSFPPISPSPFNNQPAQPQYTTQPSDSVTTRPPSSSLPHDPPGHLSLAQFPTPTVKNGSNSSTVSEIPMTSANSPGALMIPLHRDDDEVEDSPTDLPITPQNSLSKRTQHQRDLRIALTLTPTTLPYSKSSVSDSARNGEIGAPSFPSPLKTTRYESSQLFSSQPSSSSNQPSSTSDLYSTEYSSDSSVGQSFAPTTPTEKTPEDESQQNLIPPPAPRTPSVSFSSTNRPFWSNHNYDFDDDEDGETGDCFVEQFSVQDCRDDDDLC